MEKDQRLQSAGKSWRIDVSSSTDALLPRVLLVGDSILNGYLGPIRKMLEGRFYLDANAQFQDVNATGKRIFDIAQHVREKNHFELSPRKFYFFVASVLIQCVDIPQRTDT